MDDLGIRAQGYGQRLDSRPSLDKKFCPRDGGIGPMGGIDPCVHGNRWPYNDRCIPLLALTP